MSQEIDIATLPELSSFYSTNRVRDGSYIDLFYHSEDSILADTDTMLIDTPAINSMMDSQVEECCRDADMVIVLVHTYSLISTIVNIYFSHGAIESIIIQITRFVDRLKKPYTRLNLAIVCNCWDIPDEDDDMDMVKAQATRATKDILCEKLHYSDEEANERIHFLSASEQILINRDDPECGRFFMIIIEICLDDIIIILFINYHSTNN